MLKTFKFFLFTVLTLALRMYLMYRINNDFWFAMSVAMNGTSMMIIHSLDYTCAVMMLMWIIILMFKLIASVFNCIPSVSKKTK